MPPKILAHGQPSNHQSHPSRPEPFKDPNIQPCELRCDRPLSTQRRGDFMAFIDRRYPELVQGWTASQDDISHDSGNRTIPQNAARRADALIPASLPRHAKNWNDIPEDMLIPNPRQKTPRRMKKAETTETADKVANKVSSNTTLEMAEDGSAASSAAGKQSVHDFLSDIDARIARSKGGMAGQREISSLSSVSTTSGGLRNPEEYTPDAQASTTSETLPASRAVEMDPYSLIEKLELELEPFIQLHTSGEGYLSGEALRSPLFGTQEDMDLHVQYVTPPGGSHDALIPQSTDLEDFTAVNVVPQNRQDESVLCAKPKNSAAEAANKEAAHNTTRGKIALSSTNTASEEDDNFEEWSYLQARKAAGESTILPPEMRKKLLQKILADEAQRRKQDPHYQHSLTMAKVNAAEAKREAEIPNELLYPEAKAKRGSASAENYDIDLEDWYLLDECVVEGHKDQDNKSASAPVPPSDLFGLHFQNDNSIDGNYALYEQLSKRGKDLLDGYYVDDPLHPDQLIKSEQNGLPGWLGTIFKQARKVGKVVVYKRQKQKTANTVYKSGWTLKDTLDANALGKPDFVHRPKEGWTLKDVLEETMESET
ncbi:hypothetical protein BU23DRAFT_595184 [Bimuria novae-zelandiae CBS 107.79]|uniref:Uncharacterized protein n=1 Tax=Bimuria novae-zelandiae CBS 107.79 TaxID=1447943 RepID=A0A6A5VR17_9PLEO|nr:hypothetical protein BU23DRAFT_595184 [Bimuria novae-zelandiae CBS 107.79]